jgi:hypothetical protein
MPGALKPLVRPAGASVERRQPHGLQSPSRYLFNLLDFFGGNSGLKLGSVRLPPRQHSLRNPPPRLRRVLRNIRVPQLPSLTRTVPEVRAVGHTFVGTAGLKAGTQVCGGGRYDGRRDIGGLPPVIQQRSSLQGGASFLELKGGHKHTHAHAGVGISGTRSDRGWEQVRR